jgi:SAM-dependent methyltransferase
VFSSILDAPARQALAQEMLRVLKPGGYVFVYDFRISHPQNPDTTGIRKAEIRRLFPGLPFQVHSLTLAPPLARRLAPLSPVLAHILEAWCPFLRTHALYLLQK